MCSGSRAGTNDPNAGVAYYNTTAMSVMFDGMITYARKKNFKFSALDNTLMVRTCAATGRPHALR